MIYVLKNLDFLYIRAHPTQSKKTSSQFKMEESVSYFCPSCWEELGEHDIDTASNVALKGRSLLNHHLKILKGLKLLMTLSKKKEKKDMT